MEIAGASFPLFLRDDVEAVVRTLPEPRFATVLSDLQIKVDNELLEPPDRIYRPEPAAERLIPLPPAQRLILHCLYTKHHDGYVRERHVRTLLQHKVTNWAIPYVLALLGDYVREIGQAITDEADSFDREVVVEFANGNPAFMRRLRSQVVSYWNEYWRSSSLLHEYPGYIALYKLGLWRDWEGRKVLQRELKVGS
jgi:hypothetical protein